MNKMYAWFNNSNQNNTTIKFFENENEACLEISNKYKYKFYDTDFNLFKTLHRDGETTEHLDKDLTLYNENNTEYYIFDLHNTDYLCEYDVDDNFYKHLVNKEININKTIRPLSLTYLLLNNQQILSK